MDYTGILILACIFIPLERLAPLHPEQGLLRRNWANDLFYLMFNGFVVRAGAFVLVGAAMVGLRMVMDADTTEVVRSQPLWLQVIEVIIIADIGYYLAHRSFHAVPFLWQFHAVHHSIEEMDWLASHRVHPVDQIISSSVSLLPVFFLGFSSGAVAIYALIYHFHSLLVHSNIRVDFGPLKWLLASPNYHHWHHANQPEAYGRNFAAQLSIIDAIAGTLFMPGQHPEKYGLNDPMPALYHQQFLHPFRAIAQSWNQHRTTTKNHPKPKLDDRLGKLAMLLVFGSLAYRQVISVAALAAHHDAIPYWQINLIATISGTIFVTLILYYTATRLPPRDSADGLAPRAIAIVGTFISMVLILLPTPEVPVELRAISAGLIVLGTGLSIYCIRALGRSFSIVASARALVTAGPYRLVRHPLYAAELLTITGIVLANLSPAALVVGALWLVLQIRRAQNEEQVLRGCFPEYAAYARRVPMLVPGFRVDGLGRAGPGPQHALETD